MSKTRDREEFQARLRAAGLDGPLPEDIEQFRYALARQIHMFLNEWHGCREGACRRQRGCMAPSGVCANAAPLPPDPDGSRWHNVVKVKIRHAVEEHLAKHGGEEM